MSIITWTKEFYPVTADEVAKSGTDAELVEHALKKWRGLREDSLDRHYLIISDIGDIVDVRNNMEFEIDGQSCCLCVKFAHSKPIHLKCKKCPIVRSGGQQCESRESPWMIWRHDQNPEPMIATLERAAEFVRKESESSRIGEEND